MRVPRLLLALLLVPASAWSQPEYRERVTVTYVEVPVTVIAKDGSPVRDLTRGNFEVLEDGEKRDIESFDVIDFASEAPLKAISPLNPASRRYFLLLFDTSFSSPGSIDRAQAAAREFISRGAGKQDLLAVATMDVERGFRFVTAFTTDREMLVAAVANPVAFRSLDPLLIGSGSGFMGEAAEEAGGRGEEGTSTHADMAADFQRSMAKIDDARNRARVKRQVAILADVARSMQGLAGRKHLVLLSEGFDPRLVQGRGAGETREELEENLAIQMGEVWKVDSDRRFGNANAQRSIGLMAEEFRRSDVVLHAVDIQGVRVQNDVRRGAQVNSNEGLFLLANPTGGSVLRNSNDLSDDFARLARQHEVVYVVGFQAPAGRPGQFHAIEVRLAGVKNARVHHRGGYYDAGNESGVERSLGTAEVIVNDIPQDAVGVAALVAAFPTDEPEALVPVVLEVAGADLLKQAEEGAVTADFFVYAFDDEGVVRGSLNQRVRLEVAKVAARLRDSGVRFYGAMRLAPGRYAVKTLVRTVESDAKGFARVDLTVPEPDDVSMVRPLFFGDEGDWIMVRAKGGGEATYPFVLDGESFIPAARVRLSRGEPRLFAVFVYNADPEELAWEIVPEAKLVERKSVSGHTRYLFALERVLPGSAELTVILRKKDSTDERRISVPIELD